MSVTQIGARVKDRSHYYLYENLADMENDVKRWDVWFKKNARKMNKQLVDSLLQN